LKPTTDTDRIRAVFTHPSIWPHITDDTCVPTDEWEPVLVDGTHYLMPDDDSACFFLHRHTSLHWEVHSGVLPEHRGASRTLVMDGLDWMRANTTARVISTYVPRGNFAAGALAKACGFSKVGIVPASILRNGSAVDQTLYVLEL
jgi:RimJ/RimL family protein N-acetyltransferase